MEGGEESARADTEEVFGAGEGAIGYVVIRVFVEEVGGGQGEADFAIESPYGCGIEEEKVGSVALRETGKEVVGSESEVYEVAWQECEI